MKRTEWISAVIGILIGLFFGTFIVMGISKSHKSIISHGCAHYDSQTGNFTWSYKNESKGKN